MSAKWPSIAAAVLFVLAAINLAFGVAEGFWWSYASAAWCALIGAYAIAVGRYA